MADPHPLSLSSNEDNHDNSFLMSLPETASELSHVRLRTIALRVAGGDVATILAYEQFISAALAEDNELGGEVRTSPHLLTSPSPGPGQSPKAKRSAPIAVPKNDSERVWIENAAYDAASREEQTLQFIRANNEIYTKEEHDKVEEALVLLGLFRLKGIASMEPRGSNLTDFKAQFFEGAEGIYGNIEHLMRANIEDVTAFLMDTNAKHYNTTEAEHRVISRDTHGIVGWAQKPSPIDAASPREFVYKQIWKRQSADEILVVVWPTKHETILENNPGVVRAETGRIWRLKQIGPNHALVQFAIRLDLKGALPAKIKHNFIPEQLVANEVRKIVYFQHIKEEHVLTVADGAVMGELLMNGSIEERKLAGVNFFGIKQGGWHLQRGFSDKAVELFFEENAGARVVTAHSGGWFLAMCKEVCWNHVYPVEKVTKRLKELGVDDGRRIGRSYAMTILTNTSFEAAADEFIRLHPALSEVDRRYVWFRPMMVALATKALKQSKLGGLVHERVEGWGGRGGGGGGLPGHEVLCPTRVCPACLPRCDRFTLEGELGFGTLDDGHDLRRLHSSRLLRRGEKRICELDPADDAFERAAAVISSIYPNGQKCLRVGFLEGRVYNYSRVEARIGCRSRVHGQ